ncbi:putative C6 transcription factor [Aspergillus melleus]|uniref:putative C6 transcription factor n=1 Tax=Aspergillus melleus TaxID=138277 RepID=UPI001E8E578D|nr:uncharacterized protein LDX57_005207 [Aspergillus melleus]KAH8427494.1 hypothetical protein LDX57_005207 [Aspergillus melleus]
MQDHRATKRKRTTLACDACRARRTKCDSQRPACRYCQTHGVVCIYQEPPLEPPSRVEEELYALNNRLDQLIRLVLPAQSRTEYGNLVNEEDSPFDLPSKLLGNSSIMKMLGLDANFTQILVQGELTTESKSHVNPGTRMLIVRHQDTVNALAAFSARVHIWYPILPSEYSDEYFRLLSGCLLPSSETCLALLVAAIGLVIEENEASSSTPYFETALASLPNIVSECSVRSVQCLMLISLYYSCLLKPCQAHDYCLIASSKIQTIFKSGLEGDDPNIVEQTRRAYWAALLLENELAAQFDAPRSGIWCLDEHVPLPLCQQVWQFPPESTSSGTAAPVPPGGAACTDTGGEKTRSYFLAEIAMRRMLHRCNTAVQLTATGKYVYAPNIALELENQLEEWYRYLPEINRFEKGDVSQPLGLINIPSCPLSNFLRVQYYCCRLSIFWPAVYHAMQDGSVSNSLLDHCKRFLDSYVLLAPSIIAAFHDCRVNSWTVFVSIFITSVAALTAAKAPCLRGLCSPRLYQSIQASGRADRATVQKSASLMMLQGVLEKRVSEAGL